MHAYFPALNSFPSLLGDMLADAIGCLGFTWVRHCSRRVTVVTLVIMRRFHLSLGPPIDFCPIAGFESSLHRIGIVGDGLAGQDDRFTLRVLARSQRQLGWRSHPSMV